MELADRPTFTPGPRARPAAPRGYLPGAPNLLPVRRDVLEAFARRGEPDLWVRPGNMVGNGAYTLESWPFQYQLTLTQNPHYWAADAVRLRRAVILAVDDQHGAIEAEIAEQQGGSHADEIETSLMLVLDPASVDMTKAVKDLHPKAGPFTRDPTRPGTYSPTGTWGDPTLATRERGERVLEAWVAGLLRDIEALRGAPLPGGPP